MGTRKVLGGSWNSGCEHKNIAISGKCQRRKARRITDPNEWVHCPKMEIGIKKTKNENERRKI